VTFFGDMSSLLPELNHEFHSEVSISISKLLQTNVEYLRCAGVGPLAMLVGVAVLEKSEIERVTKRAASLGEYLRARLREQLGKR